MKFHKGRKNRPNRYIVGHAMRGKKFSEDHKTKISVALKAYNEQPDCHLNEIHKSGPEHPNWKGGIKPAYYQNVAFEAYGTTCQICGSTRFVVVHHKDKNRYNNDLSNLQVMCKSCHNRHHRRRVSDGVQPKGTPNEAQGEGLFRV